MTEAEWLACEDPSLLLYHLWVDGAGERKLRLVAVHCCRRVWHLLHDARSREALLIAEQFADRQVTIGEANRGWELAQAATEQRFLDGDAENAHIAIDFALTVSDHFDRSDPDENAFSTAVYLARRARGDTAEERSIQVALIRDIFGNPFRPAALAPAWRTETVLALARGIYEERAFDRMPILADALQDAGCTDEDVLGHCRGPGPHVRGCWVVDLVLGKA